jgi:2-amino-4-hydroxy-6-hydroxymethyldihydropteridine diphosphokinase
MNQVYLLIGGNLGDRFHLLEQAKGLICNTFGVLIKESSIYESEPWGFDSDQNFLNQVVVISTEFKPIDVLDKCQDIENKLGRVRESENYSSRTMDIDILFIDGKIIDTKKIIVPHEHLHKRRFTLEPLVELVPDFIHPKFNISLIDLLKECTDKSIVKKL